MYLLQTDGEVNNTQQVISFVSTHIGGKGFTFSISIHHIACCVIIHSYADYSRVFCFGIGADASKQLVKGIAEAGNGYV